MSTWLLYTMYLVLVSSSPAWWIAETSHVFRLTVLERHDALVDFDLFSTLRSRISIPRYSHQHIMSDLSEIDVKSLKVVDLKEELSKRGLETTGLKKDVSGKVRS